MATDFEALVQKAANLLKEPLRPLARPPRGDAQAQTVRIPMRGIGFPPDCPGCGKPAQQPYELVFEDIGVLFMIIALLSRRATADTYRLQVPFCAGCAGIIDRRRACIIGRVVLLLLGLFLVQSPMLMLSMAMGMHPLLSILTRLLMLSVLLLVVAGIAWLSRGVFRKDWYFGFRITGVTGDGLRVRIDDPGYAQRLQALCLGAAPAPAAR